MDEQLYMIRNKQDSSLAWDNQWGWVDGEDDTFSLFSDEERQLVSLPIDGTWWRV